MSNTSQANRPPLATYWITTHGERDIWREIGVLWPHKDGQRYNQKLDLVPLDGDGRIVIRPRPSGNRPTDQDKTEAS